MGILWCLPVLVHPTGDAASRAVSCGAWASVFVNFQRSSFPKPQTAFCLKQSHPIAINLFLLRKAVGVRLNSLKAKKVVE